MREVLLCEDGDRAASAGVIANVRLLVHRGARSDVHGPGAAGACALHGHRGWIAGRDAPDPGGGVRPGATAVRATEQSATSSKPSDLGVVKAHALRVLWRGQNPPAVPAVGGHQHFAAKLRGSGPELADVTAAGDREPDRRRDEMHRADERARLSQCRPVSAAVGCCQQRIGADSPAGPVTNEIYGRQVQPAAVLHDPIVPAVGGGQDLVLAHDPALGG